MPSSSKKQHNFMEAIAHSPGFAKKVGVPQSVGKDFSNADKGKSFSKGGDMATKMNSGFMAMIAKKKEGMHKMPDGKMMKDSAMKKMASGGFVRAADGVASKGKTKAKQIKMKSGGMAC
jgi:hypothetical protein